jgi:hypothetical protein
VPIADIDQTQAIDFSADGKTAGSRQGGIVRGRHGDRVPRCSPASSTCSASPTSSPSWRRSRLSPWFSIWKNRLGDPSTEQGRAFLTERSPLTHIDRAVRPILIAQGVQDVRVVAAESEQMVAALKQRRVPVTYISFADEGHGFARPENRIAFYAVTESFLAKHLGGRSQPIGNDFKGSSLKVETGGELVRGLKG